MNEKLIQALRSCLALGSRCEDCPLDGDYQECKIDTLYADALDAANYALEAAGRALEAAKDKLHEQDLRIADMVAHLNAEQVKVARLVTENRHLKADIADYHHMSELVDGKMEENQRLRRINENLQEQIAASQHRERAAVEDIHEIDRFNGKCFRCKSWNGVRCKRGYSANASFCNDWQWRGRAGRGGRTG